MMRKAETGMGLVLVIVALVLLQQSLLLPVAWTGIGPGAGFFPFWLAVGVSGTAIVIFLRSLRPAVGSGGDTRFIPAHAWTPLFVVFLPMVAVIAFMNYLGIYVGGAVYLAGYMWLVGRHRRVSIVLVSVLVPLILFFIFERWFLLPLPKGVLLEWILYGR